MSTDPKDRGPRYPQGVFSGQGSARNKDSANGEPEHQVEIEIDAEADLDEEAVTAQHHALPKAGHERHVTRGFEDDEATAPAMPAPHESRTEGDGSRAGVQQDIRAMADPFARSEDPPPLGHGEEHDAWSMEHGADFQSTLRPEAGEMEQLVELSSLRFSDLPSELTPGGALDLADHARPSVELNLEGHMEELYALDDLSGTLRAAELLLGRDPDNTRAAQCAADCRDRLIALYTSKLGRTDAIAVVALSDQELRWLGLDHRSGFLLSRIDGFSTVEELLDICGMPRLEALRTLADLLERGAIRLR